MNSKTTSPESCPNLARLTLSRVCRHRLFCMKRIWGWLPLGLLPLGILSLTNRLAAGPLEDWSKMGPIPQQSYVCHPTPRGLNIDGLLDETSWQAVPWTQDFADIEGSVKPKPRYRARVKMLWDDEYFYV